MCIAITQPICMQHFNSNLGEYPEGHPKPPFKCVAIGQEDEPQGQDKWRLRDDRSLEILDPRYAALADGGWRNKVCVLCGGLGMQCECRIGQR